MYRHLLLVVSLLFVSVATFASDDPATLWQRGNALYARKDYDSAAQCYEQIAASHPQNATLYYNLGNAYYRQNKVGLAVLNYERALAIKPDYKEAQDNLALTQNRMSGRLPSVGDIFFVQWWNNVTAGRKQLQWAILALVFFVAIVGSLAYNATKGRKGFRLPSQAIGILAFCWLCLLVLAIASAQNSRNSSGAVVMQNDTPLMMSEQPGKPTAVLPEGTIVKVHGAHGDFVEVTIPDGRTGWVHQAFISKI